MTYPGAGPRSPADAFDPETRAMFRALLLCELIELVEGIASDGRHQSNAEVSFAPPRRVVPALHAMTKIRDALDRLDEGTYGSCRKCKQAIPVDELRAAPIVTNCHSCPPTPEVLTRRARHRGPGNLEHRTRIWPRSSR